MYIYFGKKNKIDSSHKMFLRFQGIYRKSTIASHLFLVVLVNESQTHYYTSRNVYLTAYIRCK